MNFRTILLLPFGILYGLGAMIRNALFASGIKRAVSFPFPVISVGNLNTGGTGKTPHVCYLANLLRKTGHIAVVSRGYKRETKGVVVAGERSSAADIGDEPLMIHKRYPDITVLVSEMRVEGINRALQARPDTRAVILDDAFQHRYVTPGLSILLTAYNDLFVNDFPLPAGNLREFRCGAARADIIVVTKTPYSLAARMKNEIARRIRPAKGQTLFFSHLGYGSFMPLVTGDIRPAKDHYDTIFLVAGIASTHLLEEHLKSCCNTLAVRKFRDHHRYAVKDIAALRQEFDALPAADKIILTTEKDAVKLLDPQLQEALSSLPFFYIPVEVAFNKNDEKIFNQIMFHYAQKNNKNS